MNQMNDQTTVPSAVTLVDIFTGKTREWFAYFPEKGNVVSPSSLLGKVVRLHYCNFYQWIREDKVHSRECPDSEMVQLKQEIDVSNLERCRLIEEIDTFCIAKFGTTQTDDWSGLYINSQTIGEMMGKLSVLCLKRFFLEVKLKRASSEPKSADRKRLDKVVELIEYVSACYDRFVSNLKQGKGYMPFAQVKIYGVLNSETGRENASRN